MANTFIGNSLMSILKNFKPLEIKEEYNFDQDNEIDFSNDKNSNPNQNKKFNSKLLRKRYPQGKHGYYLKFYINEFHEAIEKKNPKKLHIHVTSKSGGNEYLKVEITHDKRDTEVVWLKIKKEDLKDDAKKMYNFIKDELDNIMKEIIERLDQDQPGLRLTEDYNVIKK